MKAYCRTSSQETQVSSVTEHGQTVLITKENYQRSDREFQLRGLLE